MSIALPPLLGHEAIRQSLAASADSDSLHHAYLLEGPPGLGKRRVADWLALYTNCTSESRPCGTCPQCVTIAAGTHPDVITLSPDPKRATATISVASVREVIRKSGFHRYGSKRRFIIIDPADAMQDAAANALLKTLEEPPEGTGFLLVVSSARSLLPTIVSRCQRVRFGAVDRDQIAGWLHLHGHGQHADIAAAASLGCPGRALHLATGGLAERDEARQQILRICQAPLGQMFKLTEAALAKKKSRADWLPTVEAWFGVIEELVRDVAIVGSGSNLPLLHADAKKLLDVWTARLYPRGIQRVNHALVQARDQLAVQVNGRLVLDAFFTTLRAELAG